MLWVTFCVSRDGSGGLEELLCRAHFLEELAPLSKGKGGVIGVEEAFRLLRCVFSLAQLVAFQGVVSNNLRSVAVVGPIFMDAVRCTANPSSAALLAGVGGIRHPLRGLAHLLLGRALGDCAALRCGFAALVSVSDAVYPVSALQIALAFGPVASIFCATLAASLPATSSGFLCFLPVCLACTVLGSVEEVSVVAIFPLGACLAAAELVRPLARGILVETLSASTLNGAIHSECRRQQEQSREYHFGR